MKYEGFHESKDQRQVHYEPACQRDTKAGRASSRSDRARLGPRVVEIVISGQSYPASLSTVLNRDRKISEFFLNVKRKCVLAVFKN